MTSISYGQVSEDWTLNPAEFEYFMTITSRIDINGETTGDSQSVVAALVDGSCRGFCSAVPYLDGWLYLLMVYGNIPDEELVFQFYDAGLDTVLNMDNSLMFVPGIGNGEPDAPYVITGVNELIFLEADDDTSSTLEDVPVLIMVLENDAFSNEADLEMNIIVEALHGSIEIQEDQSLLYNPAQDYYGMDSLSYELDNGYSVNDAWVIIDIQSVNDPPGEFELLYPSNDTLIAGSADSIVYFTWESAMDVDNDPLVYHINLFTAGDEWLLIIDDVSSPLAINVLGFPRNEIIGWNVEAFDGETFVTSLSGNVLVIGSLVEWDESGIQPAKFEFNQNYPNPFNLSTTIHYGISVPSHVSLIIYDVRGNQIQSLASEQQSAGWYNVIWNGETAEDLPISTGIYFARLNAGDHSQVIKMLFLK